MGDNYGSGIIRTKKVKTTAEDMTVHKEYLDDEDCNELQTLFYLFKPSRMLFKLLKKLPLCVLTNLSIVSEK